MFEMMVSNIHLFWWSEPRLMGKKQENYGDLLSKYLVEKISGKRVKWIQPRKIPWYKRTPRHYLAAGSIIHHAVKESIIWGSGIIDGNQIVANADFRAVRGPRTRQLLLNNNYECPEIYGDPGLLLSDYYQPRLEKKYDIGIVPHYNDYELLNQIYGDQPELRVIDLMTTDIEKTTREILECERIISSSLHGLIVAHSYNIPAIHLKFSDKVFGDGIKYLDYYESLGYNNFKFTVYNNRWKLSDLKNLFAESFQPSASSISKINKTLMTVCPF